MDDVAIDWSTAEVSVTGSETLQLSVMLTPEPDTAWINEFTRLREATAGQSWWANSPSFGGRLTAGGVEPGTEDQIRAALDEMVAEANREAVRARSEWDEKTRREEKEAEAREKAAGEMTKRFRGGG